MILGIFVGYLVLSFIATLIVVSASMIGARADRSMTPNAKGNYSVGAKLAVLNTRELPSTYATRGEHPALSHATGRA